MYGNDDKICKYWIERILIKGVEYACQIWRRIYPNWANRDDFFLKNLNFKQVKFPLEFSIIFFFVQIWENVGKIMTWRYTRTKSGIWTKLNPSFGLFFGNYGISTLWNDNNQVITKVLARYGMTITKWLKWLKWRSFAPGHRGRTNRPC